LFDLNQRNQELFRLMGTQRTEVRDLEDVTVRTETEVERKSKDLIKVQ
jgi:hypothetical protein